MKKSPPTKLNICIMHDERDCQICNPGKWEYPAPPVKNDPINHPKHYTSHPSGIECIQVVEHMGFNIGNAIKYLWRADEKGASIQDLGKAVWYVNREIEKRKKADAQ